jgi:PhnB protein
VNSKQNNLIFEKMATVSTYLNFESETEEAFNFYKSVFKTEFEGGGIMRFGDIPPSDDAPSIPETDRNLVMHVTLPILGGHMLMGTDAPGSMGFKLEKGNNVYINLQPDTRSETRQLFEALSDGGKVEQELQDMFWGDYYGSCTDKFGVKWMFNCAEKEE